MVTTPIPATAPVLPTTRPAERPTTASGRVIVTYERLVSPAIADTLWQDYETTFQPLQEQVLTGPLPDVSDDPAHAETSLRTRKARLLLRPFVGPVSRALVSRERRW